MRANRWGCSNIPTGEVFGLIFVFFFCATAVAVAFRKKQLPPVRSVRLLSFFVSRILSRSLFEMPLFERGSLLASTSFYFQSFIVFRISLMTGIRDRRAQIALLIKCPSMAALRLGLNESGRRRCDDVHVSMENHVG